MLLRKITMFAAVATAAYATIEEDNVADFHLLCEIAQAEKLPPKTAEVNDETSSIIAEINTINMSLADEAWRNLFTGDAATGTWDKKAKDYEQATFKDDWAQKWNSWNEAKANLKAKEENKEWEQRFPRPQSPTMLKNARSKLESITVEAERLEDLIKSQLQNTGAAASTMANQKVKEAIYGEGLTNYAPEKGKTLAGDGTYGQACAGGKSGKTIANDLLCICVLATAGNSDECVTNSISEGWDTDPIPAIAKLIQKCPAKAGGPLTAAKLHGMISAFASRLRSHKNVASVYQHLGKMSAGGCTGATGQLCATYKSYFGDNTKGGITSIPWVKKLEEAANIISNSHNAAATTEALKAKLRALRVSAWTIYNGNEEAKSAITNTKGHDTQQLQPAAKECNKLKSNKSTCETTGK
uniref:Variant surface glycoprotein n=1 Tax=Trypanosoma brucei TaxID=5691 RepID=A0A1V0FY46_9TRYP|nr:variant surface glycoprotein [Trypanosoma brucei]